MSNDHAMSAEEIAFNQLAASDVVPESVLDDWFARFIELSEDLHDCTIDPVRYKALCTWLKRQHYTKAHATAAWVCMEFADRTKRGSRSTVTSHDLFPSSTTMALISDRAQVVSLEAHHKALRSARELAQAGMIQQRAERTPCSEALREALGEVMRYKTALFEREDELRKVRELLAKTEERLERAREALTLCKESQSSTEIPIIQFQAVL